jgi:hypothetical protein
MNTVAAESTPRLKAGPGLRTFFRIAAAWDLSPAEQITILGQPPRSTFYKWRDRPDEVTLSRDTFERLSYIFGIYRGLQILLPNEQSADAWVKKSNSAQPFNGRSALEVMLGGNVADLHLVRRYIDAQRG